MAEATTGAALTVTVKESSTVPPLPSLAVTVMVAVPRPWAVAVRLDPSEATETVATASSEDAAVTLSASLSASLNTPLRETCRVPPSLTMVASPMALDTVGARLGVAGGGVPSLGVVCSPLVRTHWLERSLRSEWLLPVKERTNTPVATPFSKPVMV